MVIQNFLQIYYTFCGHCDSMGAGAVGAVLVRVTDTCWCIFGARIHKLVQYDFPIKKQPDFFCQAVFLFPINSHYPLTAPPQYSQHPLASGVVVAPQ